MSRLKRIQSFENEIVVVDGMWRTGKSILGPIISCFEGIQKSKLDYLFEHICVLNYLNSLSLNDSAFMLQLQADLCTYNNFIGREMNLKPNDFSSVFRHPKVFSNLIKIFKTEKMGSDITPTMIDEVKNALFKSSVVKQEKVQDRIIKDKPVLQLVSHNIFNVGEPLVQAYGERLKLILMERNPVYFLDEWKDELLWRDEEEEPRDQTPRKGNGKIPWFIFDEEEDNYLNANPMDRAILMLICLEKLKEKIKLKKIFNKNNLLTICYESFIYQPDIWIKEIASFLGKKGLKKALKYKKYLNLPRDFILDGIDKETIKKSKNTLKELEEKNYFSLKQRIEETASEAYLKEFYNLVLKYESSFDSPRTMPW